MAKKKTTEEFIAQAKAVHGDKYDYSLVKCNGKDVPVEIICPNGHHFFQRQGDHLKGHGCNYCTGHARRTTESFIEKAKEVHGDRFDYSLVSYKNSSTPVTVICKKHGPFKITPNSHIQGQICKECARLESKKPIFGVGINDYDGQVKIDGVHITSYNVWHGMLKRLFDPNALKKEPTYKGVKLCDEWYYFTSFKDWFDSHEIYFHKGWHLDKDLLCRALGLSYKIYSPDTCVFLPSEINGALATQPKYRTDLPIGVRQAESGKYHAVLCTGFASSKHLGTFDTIAEAFMAYKSTKEAWLKYLANKYKAELDPRAYNAIMSYEVRIDD